MFTEKHDRILDLIAEFIIDETNPAYERRAMLAAWHAANDSMCPPEDVAGPHDEYPMPHPADLRAWTTVLREGKDAALQSDMDRAGAYGL